jgi:hypothetical protein
MVQDVPRHLRSCGGYYFYLSLTDYLGDLKSRSCRFDVDGSADKGDASSPTVGSDQSRPKYVPFGLEVVGHMSN